MNTYGQQLIQGSNCSIILYNDGEMMVNEINRFEYKFDLLVLDVLILTTKKNWEFFMHWIYCLNIREVVGKEPHRTNSLD